MCRCHSKMAPESFVDLCQQINYSCRAGYYQWLSENSLLLTCHGYQLLLSMWTEGSAHYPESLSIK
jgi:hypothetical protein